MSLAEALAARPPLNGNVILLDTMPADEQMRPAFLEKVYIQQGNSVPAVSLVSLEASQTFHVHPIRESGLVTDFCLELGRERDMV